MSNLPCILASNLRCLRLQSGYSQTFLAEHINVSRNMYVRYESGDSYLPSDKLALLAQLYKIPMRLLTSYDLHSKWHSLYSIPPDKEAIELVAKFEQLSAVSRNTIIANMRLLQDLERGIYGDHFSPNTIEDNATWQYFCSKWPKSSV